MVVKHKIQPGLGQQTSSVKRKIQPGLGQQSAYYKTPEVTPIVNEKKGKLKADTVVLALGFKPRDELQQALMGKVAELRAIGDCAEPRKIIDAIWVSDEIKSKTIEEC